MKGTFAFVDLFASLFFLTLTLNQDLHGLKLQEPEDSARDQKLDGTELLVEVSASHLVFRGETAPLDDKVFWANLPDGTILLSIDPSLTTHQYAKIQGILHALKKSFTTVLEVQNDY